LFVIVDGETPERPKTLVGNEVKVRTVDVDGVPHVPIFTTQERLSALIEQRVGYIALKGRQVLEAFRGNHFVINPGSPFGKYLHKDEVERILSGSLFKPEEIAVQAGTKLLLGQPAAFPQHIADALCSFFARSRDVKTAFLAIAIVADSNDAPHTIVGLEVDGDWNKVIGDAALVASTVAKSGEIIDFVRVERSALDSVGLFLVEQTTPFYRRKTWYWPF